LEGFATYGRIFLHTGDAIDAIRAAQDGRRADLDACEQVSRRTAA
jgi:hypothetical protein